MRGQPGFFDIDDRLKHQLETFRSAVNFELFRPELNAALSYTEAATVRPSTDVQDPCHPGDE
jgi:transposase, IS5 family